MKRQYYFLIMFFALPLWAQGTSSGASFLKYPYVARNAALGESGVGSMNGINGALINPASLAAQKNSEILLSHTAWIQDISSEFIGGSLEFSFGSLGIVMSKTSVNGIETRLIPGPPDAVVSANSSCLGLIYAAKISEDLSIGMNAKILYEKLYVEQSTGYAFDAGLLYRTPIEGLTAGASILNVGQMDAFISEAVKLPLMIRVGAAYKYSLNEFSFIFQGDLKIEPDVDKQSFNSGAEIWFQNFVSVQAGYQSGIESRNISAGLGIKYEFLVLSYAYVPFSNDLGTAHIISLNFSL